MSKNVIITGTSRGIGLELIKLFSNSGFNVLSLSRNKNIAEKLNLNNTSCLSFDITKEEDHLLVNKFISNNWNSVDILINNAGLLINKNFQDTTLKDFNDVYNTNVFGVARLIQICLPFMKENSQVVNISSIGGVQGSVKFPGLSAYSSSKGALITLTEIADLVSMTEPSFCRYFKKLTSKTFIQFLNEYRLVHASKLLAEKKISITEVCYESGFGNFSHFNKQFKVFTGKTPSQYRADLKEIIQ